MKNKFKKGLILGTLLAIGAVAGFGMSKRGKQLTADLQADLKELTKHLRKNLGKIENVTRKSFDVMVLKAVDEYGAKKELATESKAALITALQSVWLDMKKEYSK